MVSKNRYKNIKSFNEEVSHNDWSIKVLIDSIVYDKYRGKHLLKLNIQNTSDRDIKSIVLKVTCFDKNGKNLGGDTKHSFKFIYLKPGETLSENKFINIDNSDTDNVKIDLDKVEFLDMTARDYLDDKSIVSKSKSQFFNDKELRVNKNSFIIDNDKKASTTEKKDPYVKRDIEHHLDNNTPKNTHTKANIDISSKNMKTSKGEDIGSNIEKKFKDVIEKYLFDSENSATPTKDKTDKNKFTNIFGIIIAIIFFIINIIDFDDYKQKYDDNLDADLYNEQTYEDTLGSLEEMININSDYGDIKKISTAEFYTTDNYDFPANAVFYLRDDGSVDYYTSIQDENTNFDHVYTWYNIKSISTGSAYTGAEHIVGLRHDGTAVATGSNEAGQCNVQKWKDLKDIKASTGFTVGIKKNGNVLFTGEITNEGYYTNYYFNPNDWTDISDVYFFKNSVFGLKNNGTVVYAGEKLEDIDVSSWTNIKELYTDGVNGIVGLKNDNTVVSQGHASYENNSMSSWTDIIDIYPAHFGIVGIKSDGHVIVNGTFDKQNKLENLENVRKVYIGEFNTMNSSSHIGSFYYSIIIKNNGEFEILSDIEDEDLFSNINELDDIEDLLIMNDYIIALSSSGYVAVQNLVVD